MHLIILHYHLNRGGVTSVVENHLRSLALLPADQRPSDVTVVSGGRAEAWNESLTNELPFGCELVALPELEYDNMRADGGKLADALNMLLERFDPQTTVLHVHNHSLGKNAEVAPLVCQLAQDGWHVLLQIHDFAEDLRPANYQHLLSRSESVDELRKQLYPQAAQIHYAVLNQRDHAILREAGVDGERLHLLPNPINDSPQLLDTQQLAAKRIELAQALNLSSDQRFVLYPVRPIRRKNLGELLLWSVLVEDATFAVTVAPLNPQEQTIYQRWVDFAAELGLPVVFEVVKKTKLTFEEIYSVADAIITTSVAEGFGMVYLEASLAGKPLVGRSLPGVCADFLQAGMRFPELSDAIEIPSSEVDLDELKSAYAKRLTELRTAYGLAAEEGAAQQSLESCFLADTLDFGRLELSQQMEFVRRLRAESELKDAVRRLNPAIQLSKADTGGALQETLQNNRQVIAENYSPEVIGERLYRVYQTLLSIVPGPVVHEASIATAILDRFVHPELLFPVRLEV